MKTVTFQSKLIKNELNASIYGDEVYRIGWNNKLKRPDFLIRDPGFVFPFDEDDDGEFERVVEAWEQKVGKKGYVYKREYWLDDDGRCLITAGWYEMEKPGDESLRFGKVVEYEKVDGIELKNQYTGYDYIPRILIENIDIDESYGGLSDMTPVLDIIDSMINAESDMDSNSTLLGGAVVGVKDENAMRSQFVREQTDRYLDVGKRIKEGAYTLEVAPGKVIPGGIDLLDTSKMHDALIKYAEYLLGKFAKNSRITEVGIGLRDPKDLTGIALKIIIGPLIRSIMNKKTFRYPKYEELIRRIEKLYREFGTSEERRIFADETPIEVKFQDALPVDRAAKLDEILKKKGTVSEESIIIELAENGFVKNAKEELERLKKEDENKYQVYMEQFENEMKQAEKE